MRKHLPEYLIEAFCLGVFMISACLFTALLEHPSSPVRRALPDAGFRRALIGLAMGLTAVALIYSPWGKRSGAHMNPSVTISFWRLNKIKTADALFYLLFQFIGGWLGVVLSAAMIRSWISDPSVAYAITIPGPAGVSIAWIDEFLISFFLMFIVLLSTNSKRWMPWTGVWAGSLVAFYILVEAPFSGMSMNPARTLGSAIVAGIFSQLWIYFTAPPLGMLGAAEVYRHTFGRVACAKLIHDPGEACLFCDHKNAR